MPSIDDGPAFTSPVETHYFEGLLFDMDGTIIDSTNAIVKHWHRSVPYLWRSHGSSLIRHRVAKELGVDPDAILATSHGRRTIDVIRLYDENKANWECQYMTHMSTSLTTVDQFRCQSHRADYP